MTQEEFRKENPANIIYEILSSVIDQETKANDRETDEQTKEFRKTYLNKINLTRNWFIKKIFTDRRFK